MTISEWRILSGGFATGAAASGGAWLYPVLAVSSDVPVFWIGLAFFAPAAFAAFAGFGVRLRAHRERRTPSERSGLVIIGAAVLTLLGYLVPAYLVA